VSERQFLLLLSEPEFYAIAIECSRAFQAARESGATEEEASRCASEVFCALASAEQAEFEALEAFRGKR